VCARPPGVEMFSSPPPYPVTCSDKAVCPTSPPSSVIHPQVINHQQYRKYLARQKCENTSTPKENWTEDFQLE